MACCVHTRPFLVKTSNECIHSCRAVDRKKIQENFPCHPPWNNPLLVWFPRATQKSIAINPRSILIDSIDWWAIPKEHWAQVVTSVAFKRGWQCQHCPHPSHPPCSTVWPKDFSLRTSVSRWTIILTATWERTEYALQPPFWIPLYLKRQSLRDFQTIVYHLEQSQKSGSQMITNSWYRLLFW